MNHLKYITIFFLPLALLAGEKDLSGEATDRHAAAMTKKIGLNPKEYEVDKGISWVLDKGYSKVAKPILKSIPYVGGFFSEEAENLEVAKSSLGKLREVAKEIKRGNEHIASLYGIYKKEESLRTSLTEAWKKSKTLPLLLEISKDLTGIDANPLHYLPDIPATRKLKRKWDLCLSKESEITERLKAFYQMNEYDFRLFAINTEINSLLKTIPILEDQGKILQKKIDGLKSAMPSGFGKLKNWLLQDKNAAKAKSLSDELEKTFESFNQMQARERKAISRLETLKRDLETLESDVAGNAVYARERKKLRDALRERAGIDTQIDQEKKAAYNKRMLRASLRVK